MPPGVIVTRPVHDAAGWVSQLQKNGFTAQAIPLIEIAAISSEASRLALSRACNELASYTACMFVSGNAVEHFFRAHLESNAAKVELSRGSIAPEKIAGLIFGSGRFLAPGPGTAAALLAAGIPVGQIDAPPLDSAQFDSEALWRVVGQRDWRAARVLIVRGSGDAADTSAGTGRDWLQQQWQLQGARVSVVSSYERRAALLSPRQTTAAKVASHDGSVWLFSSSEAVANLVQQPGLKDISWQAASAVATHPRIQATALAAGWGLVRSSRPAVEDVMETLRSIELNPL